MSIRSTLLRRLTLGVVIASFSALPGCSGSSDFVATPDSLVGKVDTTLPVDAQQKQKAVARFFGSHARRRGQCGATTTSRSWNSV